MPDLKRFYDDPALARIETEVVEAGEHEGRAYVRLAETILYPEGGGQPADRGTIAGVEVMDVQSRGREVLHFVAGSVALGPATVILDAARRLDHRQQHTAQHLLTALVLERLGLPTTSFHLGAAYSAIEVAGTPPAEEALRRVESECNEAILRDVPVRTFWIDPEEKEAHGVRSRGLPEGHEGKVRIVEIEGIDRNTCGGTHVARLGEIQILHVLGAEPARGGARIRYLAGGRVTRSLRDLEDLEAGIKARVGTGRDEILQVLDLWKDERKRLEKRVRDLEAEVGAHVADGIAAEPGRALLRVLEGAGLEQLRAVSRAVLAKRPEAVVALVGGAPDEAIFLVEAGKDGPEDVATVGAALRDALGARGGGKGKLFQGSRGTLRDPAALRRAIGERA
jgi:Ser-tRNA(Ala) deacylase AlaX